jgi:hypothetical protein
MQLAGLATEHEQQRRFVDVDVETVKEKIEKMKSKLAARRKR